MLLKGKQRPRKKHRLQRRRKLRVKVGTILSCQTVVIRGVIFILSKCIKQQQVVSLLSGFSLFVGNLNANKDFVEIKTALRKFFSKNDLEIADIRLGNSR